MSSNGPRPSRRIAFVAAIAGLTLAGTAVRVFWALRTRVWESAPDHLAWQLLLDEARTSGLRWDELVHYPHDMGGIVLSLLALALGTVGPFPPLAAAGLLLDTLLRAAALALVSSAYDRATALWLGVFWLFAVPLLLPWPVLGFLHSLAAIWTIVLVFLARRSLKEPPGPALLGAAAGLAIATSFDGFVLLPAAIVLALGEARARGARRLFPFALSLAGVLLLLIAARGALDLGFAGMDPLTIRGVALQARPLPPFPLIREWLLGVSQLPAIGGIPRDAIRWAWSLLAAAGLLLAAWRRERGTGAGLIVLATFAVAYLAGPFFDPKAGDVMSYRYAAYVVPLLALLVFLGFRGRRGAVFASLFVLLGAAGTIVTIRDARTGTRGDRAAGWVLAKKLGDDPPRLVRLLAIAPAAKRDDLAFGYGWGIAAARLEGKSASAPEALDAVARLGDGLPAPARAPFGEGIRFAFAPGVTPRLDPRFLPLLTAPPPAAP